MYDLISFKDVQWITDPRDQLKKGKEINIKNLRNGKIKQRYRYHKTHERAVFLKSFGPRKNGRDLCFTPPSSIIILPFDVHTYAVREGANPFTFPLSSSIQAFPISRLDNRAFPAPIMAKDKSFSPHSHYRHGMERRHSPISSSSTGTSGRR